ncbi:MAG: glycosyltransferase family 39 protein [Alphaproteobacteria bacterium]
MKAFEKDSIQILILCAVLALAAIIFRPAIPIDETRYLTAAWEMFLSHNYFLPTLNFAPYHHKPPLLFWLINLSWEIFGAHRWAAVLIISLISAGAILLTSKLCRILFPEREELARRAPWIMVASAPFLLLGTVVMFDFLLTFCVLLAWVFVAKFLTTGKRRWTIPAGLALGFGVLAKGPVVLLFTMLAWILAPLWYDGTINKKRYYLGLLAMFIVGLGPVAVWLAHVFHGTDAEFFHWLVIEQTRGRMTGNFGGAHSRPIYFYIPYYFALFLPWVFFPTFLKKLKTAKFTLKGDSVERFCGITILIPFLIFSLMSGKQAHYLVPLLPFVSIFVAQVLQAVQMQTIKRVALAAVALMVIGQGVASFTMLPRYDLTNISKIVAAYPDRDWAYVRNYHGEVGFLARREKPVHGLPDMDSLHEWFMKHPGGLAVVRYRRDEDIKPYKILFTMDYSSAKRLSVIALNPEYP